MSASTPGLAVVTAILAVVITGCSSGFVATGEEVSSHQPDSINSPTNGRMQSDTGGQVTIDVKWAEARDSSLIFEVALNTHSVDLDGYDLRELAVLRDDAGNEYHPVSWDSAPGGHHRKGTLTFPLPDSLSQGRAKYVEIVIRDVASITERVLKWEL